jgi:hypothetical protein
MKNRDIPKALWVAVKVERGYISQASLFGCRGKAQKLVRRWQARLNPDYDEVAVVKGRVSADLLKILGHKRES